MYFRGASFYAMRAIAMVISPGTGSLNFIKQVNFSESYKESASAPASCIQGIGFRIRDEDPDPPDTCR
jgi:hypothetical protein